MSLTISLQMIGKLIKNLAQGNCAIILLREAQIVLENSTVIHVEPVTHPYRVPQYPVPVLLVVPNLSFSVQNIISPRLTANTLLEAEAHIF